MAENVAVRAVRRARVSAPTRRHTHAKVARLLAIAVWWLTLSCARGFAQTDPPAKAAGREPAHAAAEPNTRNAAAKAPDRLHLCTSWAGCSPRSNGRERSPRHGETARSYVGYGAGVGAAVGLATAVGVAVLVSVAQDESIGVPIGLAVSVATMPLAASTGALLGGRRTGEHGSFRRSLGYSLWPTVLTTGVTLGLGTLVFMSFTDPDIALFSASIVALPLGAIAAALGARHGYRTGPRREAKTQAWRERLMLRPHASATLRTLGVTLGGMF